MTALLISTIVIAVFVIISIVYFSFQTGISPMPSSKLATKALLDLIPIQKGVIYELGSGWGTIALKLAKKYPHCHIIAMEISWIPWIFSKIRAFFSQCSNLQIL